MRTYFGQDEAKILADWLNSGAPEKLVAPVVYFLQVNAELGAAQRKGKAQLVRAKMA